MQSFLRWIHEADDALLNVIASFVFLIAVVAGLATASLLRDSDRHAAVPRPTPREYAISAMRECLFALPKRSQSDCRREVIEEAHFQYDRQFAEKVRAVLGVDLETVK